MYIREADVIRENYDLNPNEADRILEQYDNAIDILNICNRENELGIVSAFPVNDNDINVITYNYLSSNGVDPNTMQFYRAEEWYSPDTMARMRNTNPPLNPQQERARQSAIYSNMPLPRTPEEAAQRARYRNEPLPLTPEEVAQRARHLNPDNQRNSNVRRRRNPVARGNMNRPLSTIIEEGSENNQSTNQVQADAAREQQRQEQGQGEAIRRIVNSSTGEEIRIPPRGASLNTRYNINTGLNVVSSANGYRNAEHTPTPNASESNSTGPAYPPRVSSHPVVRAFADRLNQDKLEPYLKRADIDVTVSDGTNVDTESIHVEVETETTDGSEIGEAENNNAAASVHESERNSAAQEEADVNELVSSYEDLEEADVNELVSSYEDLEEADVNELVSAYEDLEEADVNESVSAYENREEADVNELVSLYQEQENVRDVTSENYSDRRVSSSFDSSVVSYDTSTTSYDTRSSLGTSTTSYDTSSSLNSSYISYDRSSSLDSSYFSSGKSHNSESNTGTYNRKSSDSNYSSQLVKNDSYQQTNNQRRHNQSIGARKN
jgi:hypothetical protein